MSSRDEQEQAFQADTLDEQLARLTRNTSSSADARLVRDLRAISHEYTRSGEHVWQRLAERLAQQETTPTVPRPVIPNSTRHIERSIYMQTQTPESNTLPSRQDRPPSRSGRVFALVAAVLVTVALVGSLAAVFQLARQKPSGQTGAHQQSPTPGQIVYSSPKENGAVGSLAWSADGQRVAAVGSQTQIWDATTGQHQVTVHFARAGEDVYGSPAWSPTSDLLAIPTNYEVAIVDGQTGHIVKSYTESSTTPTTSIAPSTSTGQTYLSSLFPAGYGTLPDFPALAWSPNGTQVVFAVFFGPTSGSEVQIWNPQTGQPALTLAVESNSHISALSWSPDGEYIAANMQNTAATGDVTRVVVWSVATHQVVFQKSGNLSLNDGAYWQPGSHNLAFVTPLPAPKNAVKPVLGLEIWNVTTRQLVKSIAGLNVSTWAWSPDGKEIAYAYSYSDGSASPAAVVALLDVNSGQTVSPYKVSSGTIGALAWSPNGNYIVTSENMMQDTTPTLQQSYVVQVWVA